MAAHSAPQEEVQGPNGVSSNGESEQNIAEYAAAQTSNYRPPAVSSPIQDDGEATGGATGEVAGEAAGDAHVPVPMSRRHSISDTGVSSSAGSTSGKPRSILKTFLPRPRTATIKNPVSTDDDQSHHSEDFILQRSNTVKLWRSPKLEPFTYELSPEEEEARTISHLMTLIRKTVKKPSEINAASEGGGADEGGSDEYMKQYAQYFIKLRRLERACLSFFYGEPDLCRSCSLLDLSVEKFLVKPPGTPAVRNGRSHFEPGTAAGKVFLGSMRFIVYKATICHLCRLVQNALAEQKRFKGWLEYDFVAAKGLDEKQKDELATITCWLSWQIDGHDSPTTNTHTHSRPGETPSQPRVPLARTRRLRVEWVTRRDYEAIEHGSESEPAEIVPAYLVLLARTAGLQGNDANFLGQHITTRVASVSLIDNWLKQCEHAHHFTCNPTLNQSDALNEIFEQPYFSVVDIQEKRLVPLPKGQRYAAISYTWGGFQFYNTLQRDVRPSQQSGYFDKLDNNLPKTVRDAMQLVSSLGLRYLWIDALCIIQDSNQSWNCNVKLIDQIYGNAWLTICAADGTNPTVGLVGMNKEARQISQNIERITDGVHLMVTYPAESYIKRSLWDTRAWTFQERLLSQRCIIFVEGRVFFQCRGGVQREDIYTEDTNGWSVEHQETPLKLLGVVLNRPLHAYMECVKIYTQRELTKTDDMLNAFKGVGNFLSHIMGKKGLLYGLPRSHFDWALLWQMTPAEHVTFRGKQRKRLDLKHIQKDFDSLFELLDKDLLAQHGDAISKVRDGMKRCLDAQRKKERQRRKLKRSAGSANGKTGPETPGTVSLYKQSVTDDMPDLFPTWSWCGWTGSYSQYYSHMLYGITSNVQHWLSNRTWIIWYTRDREGRLKLVWEPDSPTEKKYPDPYDLKSMKVEKRWQGYSRGPNFLEDSEDQYGRPKLDHLKERPVSEFKKTLKEFPFLNVHHKGVNPCDGDDDLRFLQFFTWSARFRLQSFEEVEGSLQQRYAILDYKDDICGVIIPDRIGTWKYGTEKTDKISLEMGCESVFEFLAISEAKEFSQEECSGWKDYKQEEADDWDLFYVMLVVEIEGVHYRFGLGKITKEAFHNYGEARSEWLEFILG